MGLGLGLWPAFAPARPLLRLQRARAGGQPSLCRAGVPLGGRAGLSH